MINKEFIISLIFKKDSGLPLSSLIVSSANADALRMALGAFKSVGDTFLVFLMESNQKNRVSPRWRGDTQRTLTNRKTNFPLPQCERKRLIEQMPSFSSVCFIGLFALCKLHSFPRRFSRFPLPSLCALPNYPFGY